MKKSIFVLLIVMTFALGANAQGQFRALIFTKTSGWHHLSIHEGVKAVKWLSARHSFDLDWDTNANVFNDENLKKYDVVIFLSTTSEILNKDQQAAFERYIQSGKGWVGIHAAADTEYDWEWYTKLVGMMFRTHPREQTAYLNVLDNDFPGMQRFPKRQIWTDEWYQYRQPALVDDLHYLIAVDEKTYDPFKKLRDGTETKGMGDFHPISWYHNYDGGRAFYTGLGHISGIYQDQVYLDHIYGGIYWAATGKGLK